MLTCDAFKDRPVAEDVEVATSAAIRSSCDAFRVGTTPGPSTKRTVVVILETVTVDTASLVAPDSVAVSAAETACTVVDENEEAANANELAIPTVPDTAGGGAGYGGRGGSGGSRGGGGDGDGGGLGGGGGGITVRKEQQV